MSNTNPSNNIVKYTAFIDTFLSAHILGCPSLATTYDAFRVMLVKMVTLLERNGVLCIRGAMPSLIMCLNATAVGLFWATITKNPYCFSILVEPSGAYSIVFQYKRKYDGREDKLFEALRIIANTPIIPYNN